MLLQSFDEHGIVCPSTANESEAFSVGRHAAGPVTLSNTILAGNLDQSTATKLPDCAGPVTSGGHNLIQNLTGCSVTLKLFSGDIFGKDPRLSLLQDNGGPTFTHAPAQSLRFISPAIDAGGTTFLEGGTACANVDQRGVSRPQDGNADGGARCDIGAFEARALTVLTLSVGEPLLEPAETTVYPGQHVVYDFTWTVPGPGWRVLDNLQLRIRDLQGTALWLKFQEVSGTLGTFSLIDPKTGEPGPAFPAGSPNRLETQAATLYLAGSSVDGPPGSRVTLRLDLSLKPLASGRTYLVEALAVDDSGNARGFDVVGIVAVP